MSRRLLTRPLAALGLSLALLASAACGSSDTDTESDDGVALKVGQFSWTAAAVQTEILKAIAEEHPELGVSSVESTPIDPAAGWVGIQRGDLDVLPEVNLPNQQEFADKAAKEVDLVSETYGGATQGWFVPRYLVEPGGAAEGLTSVDQLAEKKWADAVGGTLYDADPGWVTTQQNEKRIKAFGLEVEHKPSSEAALIAQLKRSYDRSEPVLLYFYHPHWLFEQYDLVQLEEPQPYEDGCFTGTRDDCAIPTLAAWVAARKDLEERAPKYYAMLENFSLSLDEVEKLLDTAEKEGTEPAELARQWLEDNEDRVDSWLK